MAGGSVIGRDTVVRGNVRGSGSLEILGRVEGDVTVDGDVLLGDGAAVRGNISGAQLTVQRRGAGRLARHRGGARARAAHAWSAICSRRVSGSPTARWSAATCARKVRPARPRGGAPPRVRHSGRSAALRHLLPFARGRSGPARAASIGRSSRARSKPVRASQRAARSAIRRPSPRRSHRRPVVPALPKGAKGKKKNRSVIDPLKKASPATRALLRERSFRRKRVILASGQESDFFIDCKQTVLTRRGPRARRAS